MQLDEQQLRNRGWTRDRNGDWTAPKRKRAAALDAVATGSTEPAIARPLVKKLPKHTKRKEGVALRVSLVSFRRRLVDPDAVAISCKPATDAIAMWLGINDADPRVKWEWDQVRTDGQEGVAVKIEIL